MMMSCTYVILVLYLTVKVLSHEILDKDGNPLNLGKTKAKKTTKHPKLKEYTDTAHLRPTKCQGMWLMQTFLEGIFYGPFLIYYIKTDKINSSIQQVLRSRIFITDIDITDIGYKVLFISKVDLLFQFLKNIDIHSCGHRYDSSILSLWY